MKFKKIITSMPLLYTALSATLGAVGGYAGTMGDMVNKPQPFTGWYLGAEGGIINTINNLNQNTYYPTNFDDGGFIKTADDNFTQMNKYGTGFFSLGIGDIYNDKLYFGAEAGVSIANKSNTYHDVNNSNILGILNSNGYDGSYSYQTNYIKAQLNYAEFDLDLKIGALLNQATLVYGRMGVAFNHTHYINYFNVNNLTINTGFPFSSLQYFGNANINSGNNIFGLRLGLGFEQSLFNNIALKLDYIATLYQSGKAAATGNIYYSGDAYYPMYESIKTSLNSSVITHSIMLGINLYLDDMFNR